MFLTHAVPSIAPRRLQVHRLSGTHMNVSWEPLTLTEARGFILNYTVSYTQTTRSREIVNVSVSSEQSSVVIGGLDRSKGYSVQVWASTSAGAGPANSTEIDAFHSQDSEYSLSIN